MIPHKKSVGLMVGTKAVNALSNYFRESKKRGQTKTAEFIGNLSLEDIPHHKAKRNNKVTFIQTKHA
jgi:hypothetical protein